MDDKSGDDDTREVRWLWRRDESGRGRSKKLRHSRSIMFWGPQWRQLGL